MTSKAKGKAEDNGNSYHLPVMLQETVDALQPKQDGVYVDCTFGGGGHSREILRRLGEKGRLIAFDQDADAARNLPDDSRLTFIPENFRHLTRFLRLHSQLPVDGLLADLGVSSHQFDEAERGFSYRFDAPLDMRMDKRTGQTAADILNTYSPAQLQQMLSNYGEVSNSRTLAHKLVERREAGPVKTTQELLALLEPLSRGKGYKYYSQVFQALRIEVNDELGVLKQLLEQLPGVMKEGGRVAIITFHSLEDRMVKQYFRNGGFEIDVDPLYGTRAKSPWKELHRKPIEPSETEIKNNERSRSARLRVAQFAKNQ